jgi:hypothetical protein
MRPDFAATDLRGLFCLAALVVLVVLIFYLLTLQKALRRVSPHNRLMEPGSVWLMIVPCVNIFWQFVMAVRLPGSLRNEFRERGEDDGSDYGRGIALTGAGFNVLSGVAGRLGDAVASGDGAMGITCAAGLLGLLYVVLLVVFWVKVANYSAQLAEISGAPHDWQRKLDAFNDDYDDRGPPGGRREPPPDAYREGDPGHYQ